MHDLAKVTRIQAVRPIDGKDRIELAKVENYDTVVSKGDFKPGDRCVYVFYDSILPPVEEFEFLRKRCWSEKDMGFRIRPMQLGGVVSEGLVLPMSILPEGDYSDGQVVTDILGIRLYEQPEEPVTFMPGTMPAREKLRRALLRHRLTKPLASKVPRIDFSYPAGIPKPDEDNIEALWDTVYDTNETWFVTEKVEGQGATYVLRNGRLEVYSRNRRMFDGPWMQFALDNDVKRRMRRLCRSYGKKGIVIQGELCGPGIQKNVYGFSGLRFFVFGVLELDGERLSALWMSEISDALGLETVPVIYPDRSLCSTIEMVLADCKGRSELADVPREGLVWRSHSSDLHFKAKNREYKVWFDSLYFRRGR